MQVQSIKGQGEEKDAVLGVTLYPESDEEIALLMLLADAGAEVTKDEGATYLVITPKSLVEDQSEEKPADTGHLETGQFLG